MHVKHIGFALFGLFALTSAASAADKVTFQLAWLPGGDKAAVYTCAHHGFCAKEGIDLKILAGKGSTDALTKIATGSADIGTTGLGVLMAARVRDNIKVKALASIYNKGPHAFFVVKGGKIKKFADVKGKKIGTSPFTSSNVYLPLVLRGNGLSDKDVKLIKTNAGALGPMLANGNLDAIITWVTNIARYRDQLKEVGKELMIMPWSEVGLDLYSTSLISSEKFIKEKPDVVRRFVKAYLKSVEFAAKNPKKAADAVRAMVPETKTENLVAAWQDAVKLMVNEVSLRDGLGALTPSRMAITWKVVSKAQKIDPKLLDLDALVDRSFLPKPLNKM